MLAISLCASTEARAGNLLVSSADSNNVLEYDQSTGAFLRAFVPAGTGGLNRPEGLTFGPNGTLYVCSQGTGSVLMFDGKTGAFLGTFASGLRTPTEAVFGPDGNVYVSDYDASAVIRFDGKTGQNLGTFATGRLLGANGLCFGPDKNLYVASMYAGRGTIVDRFDGKTGAYLGPFISPATNGGLWNPESLRFSSAGDKLYVTCGVSGIFEFDASTGAFTRAFATDTTSPVGIEFDKGGAVYTTSRDPAYVARYDLATGNLLGDFVGVNTPGYNVNGGLSRPSFLRFEPDLALVASAGPAQTVSAGPSGTATVQLDGTLSSDPDGDPLTFTWTGAFGTATGATPSVTLGMGTSTITLVIADPAGDSATATVAITVVDTTPPVFSNVPGPISANATGPSGAAVSVPLPTATDNVDGNVTVTSDAPATFPLGTTTVTFSATDKAGNKAMAQTTVTVADLSPPVFSNVPGPMSVTATSASGTTVTVPLPTATDLVDGNVPVTSDAPATFPIGTTTVTFTAKDKAGNTATASTTVSVVATTPTITSIAATPAIIRNHFGRLVPVTITAVVSDPGDPSPRVEIVSVSSTAPAPRGDVRLPDYVITGPLSLEVRARLVHGQKTVYTIWVQATNWAGNSYRKSVTVTVEHRCGDEADHDRDDR